PVGLVSAAALAEAGIQVRVFESRLNVGEDLRASTFHPPTLDMLDRFGISEKLVSMGLKARYTQQRDRKEGLVAEIDLQSLSDLTRYPFRLQCEQWKLAELLVEHLKGYPNVELNFGSAVESVSQDDGHVEIQVRSGDAVRTVKGDYLIGADGAWSAVRRGAGIEFDGYTYPERFLVVS